MTVSINGTSGIVNDATDLNYTGTLTGGTGVVNLGSGQVYKDASGNVGIGTSSPTASSSNKTLTLNSPATFGSLVDFKTSETLNFRIFSGVSNSVLSVKTATPLIFETNDTERARIDSSGNLLVGTTSGTGSVTRVQILADAVNAAVCTQVPSTSSFGHILFRNPNGLVGQINTSGTSTAYNTSSDYRLKEAIAPMTGALARNALLNPVFYKWKVDGSEGEGFIADQLQGPFPNAVTGKKDAVDADGKPVYQGIGTGPLDGHFAACVNELTQLIQEQQTLITALTARITALEGTAA